LLKFELPAPRCTTYGARFAASATGRVRISSPRRLTTSRKLPRRWPPIVLVVVLRPRGSSPPADREDDQGNSRFNAHQSSSIDPSYGVGVATGVSAAGVGLGAAGVGADSTGVGDGELSGFGDGEGLAFALLFLA
jgi:hypothetical protein